MAEVEYENQLRAGSQPAPHPRRASCDVDALLLLRRNTPGMVWSERMPRIRRLRNVRRLVRWIRSAFSPSDNHADYSAWPTTEAQIYSTQSGCVNQYPGTEILYTYHAGGDRFSGAFRISFAELAAANEYASVRRPGSKIVVRYSPAAPGRSVMLERDQSNQNPVVAAMQGG